MKMNKSFIPEQSSLRTRLGALLYISLRPQPWLSQQTYVLFPQGRSLLQRGHQVSVIGKLGKHMILKHKEPAVERPYTCPKPHSFRQPHLTHATRDQDIMLWLQDSGLSRLVYRRQELLPRTIVAIVFCLGDTVDAVICKPVWYRQYLNGPVNISIPDQSCR